MKRNAVRASASAFAATLLVLVLASAASADGGASACGYGSEVCRGASRVGNVQYRYSQCYGRDICGNHCDEHGCTRRCCCCRCLCRLFTPGGGPPSKCMDISLYRVLYPMSPWYSNPRDGILYPAYGSASPTCP